MDRANKEMEAVEQAVKEVREQDTHELGELQLALVGGGCGDTILA